MRNTLNIAFTINDSYAQHLCVALASILENNQASDINFYVLYPSISNQNIDKITSLVKCYTNANINFKSIDTTIFKNINNTSVEFYYKFLIPSLCSNLEKVLYLDADVIVNGDLTDLWNTNLTNYYCAGVRNLSMYKRNYPSELDFYENDLYVDTGVLLLNLKDIIKHNIDKELFKNLKKYYKKVLYPQYDIFNITYQGKIKQLDGIYNFTTEHQFSDISRYSQVKIVHWSGDNKPWLFTENSAPLTYLYYNYLEKTPYKPKVSIFSFYHKPYYLFHTDCIIPMQNGAAIVDDLLPILHDNTGDNISEKNIHYAELTGNYWVWKNFLLMHPDLEYVGFCHYRRFLDFSTPAVSKRCFMKFMNYKTFAINYKEEYTAEKVYNYIKDYDIVLSELHHLLPQEGTIYQQFITNHPKSEIDKFVDIIKQNYPEMVIDMEGFLKGNTGYFCLNYVMKRKLFDNFMKWTFDILTKLDKKTDWNQYKDYLTEKTPAYLMERFFNVWLRYQVRVNNIKISECEGIILTDDKGNYEQDKIITKKIFPGLKISKSKNRCIYNLFGLNIEKNKTTDYKSFSIYLSFKIKNFFKKKIKKSHIKKKIFPGIFLIKNNDSRILSIFKILKIHFSVVKSPECKRYYWRNFVFTKWNENFKKIQKRFQEKFIEHKKIKLVATLLVRDERDIVEENIKFHLRQGVDFIIATDNGSVDGTRDILLKYQEKGVLHLIDEPSHDYNQVAWVHKMVKLAKKKYKADWIINLDADEFWFSQRGNLKEDLMILDKYNVIYIPSLFMYPEENKPQGEPFFYNVKGQYKNLMKCIHKTKGYKKIHMGSHSVDMKKNKSTIYAGISLFHYFMRSYEQFENKTILSGKALKKNKQLTNNQGWMMIELYNKYLSGDLKEEYKKRLLSPYNSYIYDTRLKDYYMNNMNTRFEIWKTNQINQETN